MEGFRTGRRYGTLSTAAGTPLPSTPQHPVHVTRLLGSSGDQQDKEPEQQPRRGAPAGSEGEREVTHLPAECEAPPSPTPRSSRGHSRDPQPRRLQGSCTPQPLVCRGTGFPRYPCPPARRLPGPGASLPWCPRGIGAPGVPPRLHRGPPAPQGAGVSLPGGSRFPAPPLHGGSVLPALPVPPPPPHPRRFHGPGVPRSPGAHPVRMVPARRRQRSAARLGSARSGGISAARGAGRGGAAGPARPGRV
ncbi:unnamed protein product, partial [Coccothraustes coccothraustes]